MPVAALLVPYNSPGPALALIHFLAGVVGNFSATRAPRLHLVRPEVVHSPRPAKGLSFSSRPTSEEPCRS